MNKLFSFFAIFSLLHVSGQSFAPAPGNPGTTAIHKDSSCFVAWASGAVIQRGYVDIQDTSAMYDGSNKATYGTVENALGQAQGSASEVVSLGDSGYITLTFPLFITDGPGFDFAVFENGFMDNYMEFAHVEVSSDGINFVRFPSVTEIPVSPQLGNASTSDCRYVHNLAGKYRIGYGTPFDLSELPEDSLLNLQAVSHIRLIDAIGAVSGTGTTDQYGTVINDPYPTPFASCGFDLDAVGIINGTLETSELNIDNITFWPNPATQQIRIQSTIPFNVQVWNTNGQFICELSGTGTTDLDFQETGIAPGAYLLRFTTSEGQSIRKLIVTE